MNRKPRVQDVEMNVLYMMSQAMDKLLMDADKRGILRNDVRVVREKKMLYRRLTSCISGAFRAIGEMNDDIEFCAKDDYTKLDLWAEESNELCRLVLLFADKCGKNVDNANAVFKFLRSLDGEGIITEDDLDKFRLKK